MDINPRYSQQNIVLRPVMIATSYSQLSQKLKMSFLLVFGLYRQACLKKSQNYTLKLIEINPYFLPYFTSFDQVNLAFWIPRIQMHRLQHGNLLKPPSIR